MRNLYLRQDLNPILVAIMLSMFLKIQLSVWKNDKDAKYLIAELLMSVIKTSPLGQLQKMADEYMPKNS